MKDYIPGITIGFVVGLILIISDQSKQINESIKRIEYLELKLDENMKAAIQQTAEIDSLLNGTINNGWKATYKRKE